MCFYLLDEQMGEGRVQRQSRHFSTFLGDLTRPVQSAQHDEGLERLCQGGAARGGHVVKRERVFYAHDLELQNNLEKTDDSHGQDAFDDTLVFLSRGWRFFGGHGEMHELVKQSLSTRF